MDIETSIGEDKEKILKLLALGNLSTEEISLSIGANEVTSEYYLYELADSKYITYFPGIITDGEPNRPWLIEQAGRKYLFTHGLLK